MSYENTISLTLLTQSLYAPLVLSMVEDDPSLKQVKSLNFFFKFQSFFMCLRAFSSHLIYIHPSDGKFSPRRRHSTHVHDSHSIKKTHKHMKFINIYKIR